MKIRLITIGKMRRGPHLDIATDYVNRIQRYTRFELVSLKSEEELLKRRERGDVLVISDEGGVELTSKEFAGLIKEKQDRSVKSLVFAIGAAEGFSERIKAGADFRLAFSRFTIQHDLAALVLLEQIYRALTIIGGEKYHK